MLEINQHFKEHFRAATFEIIWESSPFLNKNVGSNSTVLLGRNSANQVFQKMLQNFPKHLTVASLGNNS